MMRLFYLSFCNRDLPKGQQLIGCTVVEAEGPASAIQEATRLGINLGGEVAISELRDLPAEVRDCLNRLVPREELLANPWRQIYWPI